MRLLVLKNLLLNIGSLFYIVFFISCNKENAFDCVKSTGDEIEKIINTDVFHSVFVEDNIDVVFGQQEGETIRLLAGKNIIPKISFEVKDQVLYIRNGNKCNWVRKYENPKVYISTKELDKISQNGSGSITSAHHLVYRDLSIENFDGNGDINLDLDVENLTVFSKTFSLISLSGRASNLNLIYVQNFGKFFGEKLLSDHVIVSHLGLNTLRVYPLRSLNCTLGENGNLEYFNEPEVLESNVSGKGQLIRRY